MSSGRGSARPGNHRGFTLIELLVVITIIALLISILLPALAQAKKLAKMLTEQANVNQRQTGWHQYATDYKQGIIIPYVHWTWAHPSPGSILMRPHDIFNDTARDIEGDVVKVWPLRWMYYAGFEWEPMQLDASTRSAIRSRVSTPTGQGANPPTNMYDDPLRMQYGMAWHSGFGLNSVYVGGHYRRGAFVNGTGDRVGHPLRGGQGGHFYASKLDDIRDTVTLMVGASSRSGDVSTTSRTAIGYGGTPVPVTAATPVIPGYYEVLPPRTGFPLTGGSATNWVASNKFDERQTPVSWGCVDFRHFSKAVAGHADGHVTVKTIQEMRDMRMWSNFADRADWNFVSQ